MTLCPIAIVSSCTKCPAFKPCPLKSVIGDYRPEAPAAARRGAASKPATKKRK